MTLETITPLDDDPAVSYTTPGDTIEQSGPRLINSRGRLTSIR